MFFHMLGVPGASLGPPGGVLGRPGGVLGASWGLLGRLGGLLGGGLGSPGGLGGLLEGFWAGPGVVSEVPGGLPDIEKAQGLGYGEPLGRRGPAGEGGRGEGKTSKEECPGS